MTTVTSRETVEREREANTKGLVEGLVDRNWPLQAGLEVDIHCSRAKSSGRVHVPSALLTPFRLFLANKGDLCSFPHTLL